MSGFTTHHTIGKAAVRRSRRTLLAMTPMPAFVLDCHPDATSNQMVLWLKHTATGRVVRRREPFAPTFYVASRVGAAALDQLASKLSAIPQLELARTQRRLGLDHEPSDVLQVRVGTPSTFRHIAHTVDKLGDHRTLDLYDVDLRLSHQYLLSKGLFPLARVTERHGELVLDDDQWALDYDPPTLTKAKLTATPATAEGQVPSHNDPVAQATLSMQGGETVVLDGSEDAVLEELDQAMAELDPDVLLTEDGDRFLIRYIKHRAAQAGVPVQLGRASDPDRPLRQERSYFTYGKIAYQPRVEVLHGRLHIDTTDSFFFQEAGFWGLIDLSRITSTPIQELARVGAGTAVTAIQIDRAKREGRVVPWKKNRVEDPKTEHTLVKADRGGFIFDPRVGLFDDVVELDFASMYPAIMVTRNVSPETILCTCCRDDPQARRVPQVGYHTCQRSGFIGRALAPLIERRETFKRLRHERPEETERFQAAVDAIKWLAVCSFGYQGYKNARFGRIECHEAITAWGREILLTCAEIAREEGFEVLHGIVDSLWLQRTEPWADPAVLARRATDELGIPLEMEGAYDWIVFLPTRAYSMGLPASGGRGTGGLEAAGALNRFYGCFSRPPDAPSRSQAGQDVDYLDRGRLKVRGVELRQHSAPGIVVRAQEAALLELAQARDAPGFRERSPAALDAVVPVLEELRGGRTPPEDLVITKRVSQPLDHYRVMNDTRAALEQLDRHGIEVAPGDWVRYIVMDATSRRPGERLAEVRLDPDPSGYDRGHYEDLVLRALASLLLPLGWDQERLARFYSRQREAKLTAFG